MSDNSEVQKVRDRYARREELISQESLYSPLRASVYLSQQEKHRALISLLAEAGIDSLKEMKLLEIGCGFGNNLMELIQLGFLPENVVGNELLPARAESAQHRLPMATQIVVGDACSLSLPSESFDVVYQSMVFSSVLNVEFQCQLAEKMWDLVKPGGAVLWYDFVFDNPKNPDVKGVPVRSIRGLFPQAKIIVRPITLAPIISRVVTKVHPLLYGFFNVRPLRTHVLCWIEKT
jgi:ubiquinone/menaquinone biosynthesis C-methylase UbiE